MSAVRTTRTVLAGALVAGLPGHGARRAPRLADSGTGGSGDHARHPAGDPGRGRRRCARGRRPGPGRPGRLDRHRGRARAPAAGPLPRRLHHQDLRRHRAAPTAGRGPADLDDTVDKWLPGVVRGNGHDGRRSPSGSCSTTPAAIYNYTDDDELRRRRSSAARLPRAPLRHLAPEQLVDIAMAHTPEFAPGTSWNYSNTNYILAGMVDREGDGHVRTARRSSDRIIRPARAAAPRRPGHRRHGCRGRSRRAYSTLVRGPRRRRVHDVDRAEPVASPGRPARWSPTPPTCSRFYRALLQGPACCRAKQLREMTDHRRDGPEGLRTSATASA